MNVVKISHESVQIAAQAGMDEFVNVFYDAIMDYSGGEVTAETMQGINADQMTLVVFKILHEEINECL